MSDHPDFNMIIALDAMLSEQSILRAARRLGLSTSAMSRALGRLRETMQDPLLVRAGRKMVLTPYAESIQERTHAAVLEVDSLLRPVAYDSDISKLRRNFFIRSNDGFVEVFAAALLAAASQSAPGVRLQFVPKSEKSDQPLRDGHVDLEIGVVGEMGPEIRLQTLFHDHFIGVVHRDHPLTQQQKITPEQYCAYGHVVTSRHGKARGPIDKALVKLGLQRHITAVVPTFAAALAVARRSDLIALIPHLFMTNIARQEPASNTYFEFELPVQTDAIAISQMWHPRLQADPAHRWLRELVSRVCQAQIS